MLKTSLQRTYAILFLMLALNFGLWSITHHARGKWGGVPPAPSEATATLMTLSDPQFSYRTGALTLQNIGDTGGRSTALRLYNYQKLSSWFWLLNKLDPDANYVPMTVAYYYGAVANQPEKMRYIVDFLAEIGKNPDGVKWRWLAHAVFLARYKLNDLEYALELAYTLADMEPSGDYLPLWARHMPAFVLTAIGEKDAARALIEGVMLTGKDINPKEMFFMKDYLINRLGVPEDEIGNSLMTVP